MKVKNFTRQTIRVTAPIGGHVLLVKSGQTRDVPAHLEDAAIRAGLVPLEDIELQAEREAAILAEEKAKAEAKAKEEAKAAEEQAAALEEAARKAKASEAAKKAAATRAANKAAGK
ncbi:MULTISPECIES: hypothetical protein [Pseudoalteromonas]|uniref:hypothetical protein n=1 Tax=Pseudoalteromonas TaxID=53246 RepID=UPI0006DD2822|nr:MULTISPECIES: hypothetical protein [Pseudoalteromonas]KPW03236.1 hypothetical protein AN390_01311 [Pseudoalteromonas sp. P1-11]MAA72702.1 hypothetical protein [Bermanella sp.]MBN38229.1 hypothetical protein [Opitutae bacterium]MDI3243817.1 hypothetical protein [Pseudoalteromonas agarivorans]|tara:strand:- start:24145 stop:24492 length:348 start_codon:yes stop_codon:yes gene_type:complete